MDCKVASSSVTDANMMLKNIKMLSTAKCAKRRNGIVNKKSVTAKMKTVSHMGSKKLDVQTK